MKKRFGVAALVVAAGCAVIFAGCTGCNGCGDNGKSNEAAFSSNWYADTNFRYIQPTFTEGNDAYKGAEIVTYTVKQDKESAANKWYSVDYAESTYTTKFYGVKFDKTLIDDEFKASYPEKDITVYCYETTLEVPKVTFTLGDETPKEFTGKSIKTVSYFLGVNEHLRPLYSAQSINIVSPAEYQVSKLEDAYLEVNQEIKTSYNYEGTAAKTVITGDNATEFVTNLSDTNNSLIDVNGLNIAVRAMQLGENFSQAISVYSPAGKMQSYTFAGSSSALAAEERKGYEDILDGKGLFAKGDNKSLNTVCVTATLNADLKGVSQKYWFAAINSAKNNTARTTMVKMSVPLTFGLGTLNYTLSGITSTLY